MGSQEQMADQVDGVHLEESVGSAEPGLQGGCSTASPRQFQGLLQPG